MSTQKQQTEQQPRNEETPPRQSDRPGQVAGKVNLRESSRTPQSPPIGKRADQEDFDGPPIEKKSPRKKQPPSDIPKYQ